MSRTFTKLFSSITASTVWCEPDRTRLVWITMLAMADHAGRVHGSIPGLAHMARVPLEDCETALHTFLNPDPYSRTPDWEGRRIEVIDGGWRLLNYAKHRAIKDAESVKESKRAYINDRRAKERAAAPVEPVELSRSASTQEEEEAEADKSRAKKKASVQPTAARRRFADFWAVYPNKKGKQEAEKRWQRDKLDAIADQIIAHVGYMKANDDGWNRGYEPMGSTYLNQARWTDEARAAPKAATAAPSKTMQALMQLNGMKGNGLDHKRDQSGIIEADFFVVGSDSGAGRLAWDAGNVARSFDDEPAMG